MYICIYVCIFMYEYTCVYMIVQNFCGLAFQGTGLEGFASPWRDLLLLEVMKSYKKRFLL